MKIKSYKQIDGKWVLGTSEIGLYEHLKNTLWVLVSYYRGRLVDWYDTVCK